MAFDIEIADNGWIVTDRERGKYKKLFVDLEKLLNHLASMLASPPNYCIGDRVVIERRTPVTLEEEEKES